MAVTNIKRKLALASATLLAHEAQAEQEETTQLYNKWDIDAGYLYYNEPDYITVHTYMAMISGNLSDKDNIKLGLVFDTLTGATPTGALPNSESVTVTGVSGGAGKASNSTGGTAPFNDTRLAIDASWGHEWERLLRSKAGMAVSVEGDYTSIGGSLTLEKDSHDKTQTYSLGFGFSADKVGRSNEQTPVPLTKSSEGAMLGSGHKNTFDTLFGITRVINKHTVGMLNFSYSHSLGYHTDPYKVVSIADANDIEISDGAVFENRPDSRERFITYAKIKHQVPSSGHHIGISYRFHTDSWKLNSHTIETSYSFPVMKKHTLEPFVRLYHQQAADFYSKKIPFIVDFDTSVSQISHASADVRLAEILSTTIGAKFKYTTSESGSIDFRLAYYLRDYSDAVINKDGALFLVVDLGKSFN